MLIQNFVFCLFMYPHIFSFKFSEKGFMPHDKDVKRLLYSKNPPEPAPAYPGRRSRNNTSGSTLTWQEFVQEETDQWLKYVIKSPSYSITYMADKMKCLMQHLRFTKKSKLTQLQLPSLI